MLRHMLLYPGPNRFGYSYYQESVELFDGGAGFAYFVDDGGDIALNTSGATAGYMAPNASVAGAETMLSDGSYVFAEN